MRGTNITMIQLAERIGPYFERPVIDRTGLTGSFDFRTEYARAAKGPVETIVVDHAEKLAAN